jgi:DNA-binding transcriptional LysR family regulator
MPDLALDLRFAIAAAEHGSFRGAGLALGFPESAISRRIRHLEDAIGFLLFERSYAGVRLTEAGRQFLRDARAMLEHLERATVSAQSVASGTLGHLRLAASEDAVTSTLARALAAHRVRWPNVSLDLVEMPPSEQIHALQTGAIDLGLMLPPFEQERLSADPLWSEMCVAVLPETHPFAGRTELQVEDIAGQNVVVGRLDRGPRYGRLIVGMLTGMGISVNVVAEVEHVQTQLMMVQAGVGIAFVPAALTAFPSADIVFRRVPPMLDKINVHAVWATDDPSGLVAQFLRTARKETAGNPSAD